MMMCLGDWQKHIHRYGIASTQNIVVGVQGIETGTFKGKQNLRDMGPVSRDFRKLVGPEKSYTKLPIACFGKPIFQDVLKRQELSKMIVEFKDFNHSVRKIQREL